MELSRQMLLLTAENYGSYYLHITKVGNRNHFYNNEKQILLSIFITKIIMITY